MAKIDYWDAESLSMVSSREDYRELWQSLEWESNGVRMVEVGYLHDRTGLVTSDVQKFESWLHSIENK